MTSAGKRVAVPLFELADSPSVPMSDVKSRRFVSFLCPICRTRVRGLLEHCRDVGDDEHTVLEVMGS